MKLFLRYLRTKIKTAAVLLLFAVLFLVIFCLYRLPLGAVLYPMAICALLGLCYLLIDFLSVRRKYLTVCRLKNPIPESLRVFPSCSSITEEAYQSVIRTLTEQQQATETALNERYRETVSYYTVWAHQIKTPIASMRLNLQNEDSSFSRKLQNDLNRIEQYVEMVLAFIRLDSPSSDYVIRSVDLDSVVRPVLRKFAGDFIAKHLTVTYDVPPIAVLTDEKWLAVVLEQILSNAVKYTQTGGIAISVEAPATLCIRDSGIGIAAEDLPRIFEKGFTGYNGRMQKQASGIGLYLCKRICERLGHRISAESAPGAGTVIRLDLASEKMDIE